MFSLANNEVIRKNQEDLLPRYIHKNELKNNWKSKGIEINLTPLACPSLQNPFLIKVIAQLISFENKEHYLNKTRT
jgi:hypothetical protein